MCGQINHVLCYFSKPNSVTNVSLLNTFCNSLYGGSPLWDLGQSSINDVCVSWRKEVRRVWSHSGCTLYTLLSIVYDSIPLIDALFRSANFINSCLKSDNPAVCAVARHNVYYSRMRPPKGNVVRVMTYVQVILR